MNITDGLKEVLAWIASHAQRLSRQGLTVKNPLENAALRFYNEDSTVPAATYSDELLSIANPHPIVLDGQGRLNGPVFVKSDQGYRLQISDEQGGLLFTQDHIRNGKLP